MNKLIPPIELAGLILAAGKGERLRPLTETIPKPLIEVGGSTLLDSALKSMPLQPSTIAVNACYLASQIEAHLADSPVHVAVEPNPLGSAGAVGNIKPWLKGRALMIRNADMWFGSAPDALWRDWSGEFPRLLVQETRAAADFGTKRFLGWSLLPAKDALALEAVRSGLLDLVWAPAMKRGELEFIEFDGIAIDCGTTYDLERARDAARE